jgi:hypothetical protein
MMAEKMRGAVKSAERRTLIRNSIDRRKTMKRVALVAGGSLLAVTLLVSGAVSPVFAQDDTTTTDETSAVNFRDAYLEALAAELGMTVEELEAAMTEADLQMVDLWAEQARDRIHSGESLLPGVGGMGGGTARGGLGILDRTHDRVGDQGMLGGPEFAGEGLADFAAFLGITEDELRADLSSGMNMLEIAEANGKTVDELRAYLMERAAERITERIDGLIAETEEATDTTETSA